MPKSKRQNAPSFFGVFTRFRAECAKEIECLDRDFIKNDGTVKKTDPGTPEGIERPNDY